MIDALYDAAAPALRGWLDKNRARVVAVSQRVAYARGGGSTAMPVLDPAHTALLGAFRLYAQHPNRGSGVVDFGASTLDALMARWDFPNDVRRVIVWVYGPGTAGSPKLNAPAKVKAVRDALVEEGTLTVKTRNRTGTPTGWAFTEPPTRFASHAEFSAAMRALFDAPPPTPPVKAPPPTVEAATPVQAIVNVLRNPPPAIRAHSFLLHPLWIRTIAERAGMSPAQIDTFAPAGTTQRPTAEQARYMDAEEAGRVTITPGRLLSDGPEWSTLIAGLVRDGALIPADPSRPLNVGAEYRFAGAPPSTPLLMPPLSKAQQTALALAYEQAEQDRARGMSSTLVSPFYADGRGKVTIDTRALRALAEMGLARPAHKAGAIRLDAGAPAWDRNVVRAFDLTEAGSRVGALLHARGVA